MGTSEMHTERETLTADDISLTQTCGACPEQYDAYGPDGRQVGYLRLRHGYFTVDMPAPNGFEVYSAMPDGDGIFTPDERDGYLRTAREKIAEHLNAADTPATADEREQLPPMPPGWMPATESQVAGIRSHIDQHWQPVILDLIALDSAGALGGIRAIITERLRQVRDGIPAGLPYSALVKLGEMDGDPLRDTLARDGACVAAEIDRMEGGQP